MAGKPKGIEPTIVTSFRIEPSVKEIVEQDHESLSKYLNKKLKEDGYVPWASDKDEDAA